MLVLASFLELIQQVQQVQEVQQVQQVFSYIINLLRLFCFCCLAQCLPLVVLLRVETHQHIMWDSLEQLYVLV